MASGEVRAFDARTGALGGRSTHFRKMPTPAAPTPGPASSSTSRTISCSFQRAVRALIISVDCGPARTATRTRLLRCAPRRVRCLELPDGAPRSLGLRCRLAPGPLSRAKAPRSRSDSKTGHLFLFERLTGKPLFPIRERAVATSDVPGEQAAATQPFPERPPSLVPQQVRASKISGARPPRISRPAATCFGRCAMKASSRRRASTAASSCRATSAGCIGVARLGSHHPAC